MPFSTEDIEQLLQKHFAQKAKKIKALPGEVDLNYYIEDKFGQAFVLKIARVGENVDNLDLQNKAMLHLEHQNLPLQLPTVVANQQGNYISSIQDHSGKARLMRMLTWVPGRLWAKVNPHTSGLLESLGASLGMLCQGLSNFDHPAAHRFYKWDNAQAGWTFDYLDQIDKPEQRKLSDYFFNLFQNNVIPIQDQLRQSVIYNDGNDYNVLVSNDLENPKVIGVIDFGDTIFTHTVNDLAVSAAYAIMDKPDPLTAAALMVKGFHQSYPLQAIEIEAIFPLICARLLISVTVAAINKRANPENEYLLISERPAWDLLKKLRQINPGFAHYTFRAACGLEPCPKKKRFLEWVKKQNNFHPIVDVDFEKTAYRWLDLSVGSLDLGNNNNYENDQIFSSTIANLLAEEQVEIGVGGYLETRPLYTTDHYITPGNEGPKWRTVHLGLDIWMTPGTPIFAPLSGTVFSLQNNIGDRNYGPTIILRHEVEPGFYFYTLYGHLSLEGLEHLEEGMPIKKGQQIATFGPCPENGNWPPHLHFQLMLDHLGIKGDFPGVGFPAQKKFGRAFALTQICY